MQKSPCPAFIYKERARHKKVEPEGHAPQASLVFPASKSQTLSGQLFLVTLSTLQTMHDDRKSENYWREIEVHLLRSKSKISRMLHS